MRKKCNPCRLANSLIYCGEDLVNIGVQGGDNYLEVLNKIDQVIQSGGGQYIPLSGTDGDTPVTGDIEIGMYGTNNGLIFGDIVNLFSRIGFNDEYAPFLSFSSNGLEQAKLYLSDAVRVASQDPNFLGIVGDNYYGNNYTPNTYVQKQYVDTQLISLDYGQSVSTSGRNVQIFTSITGTGQSNVFLLSNPIGSIVFVSDLGNDATNNNVVIDSGSGNNILKGDGSMPSQTLTIDSSGVSFTLRKMTNTNWMVIGTNQ